MIAVIQSYLLFNAKVKFEAYSENDYGYMNIVIRENSTYKIEELDGVNTNYFYGTYKIISDTLILKPSRSGRAIQKFLIKKDTLFKFDKEGQLITNPEYAFEIAK
jgi:hypothetical protein